MIEIQLQSNLNAARRHPWIMADEIAQLSATPRPGETVLVRDTEGTPRGLAGWSPDSLIKARFWHFSPDTPVDDAFFVARIAHAIAGRSILLGSGASNAMRLVNAEADGLPGLVVDRYDDFLVCQFITPATELWKSAILAALQQLWPCRGIFERSDTSERAREGLPPLCGPISGDEPPALIEIEEHECRFKVDLRNGHKTGFYLDQRDNRSLIAPYATGGDMLNLFAYTGSFGVMAHKAGATSVVQVDASYEALELAQENARLNVCKVREDDFIEENVMRSLQSFKQDGRTFDLIVVDPPKFIDASQHLAAASRGYRELNSLAIGLLRPGGILATFSSSRPVSAELFHKLISDAALTCQRNLQVIRQLHPATDHPENLYLPGQQHLKGLLCRILD